MRRRDFSKKLAASAGALILPIPGHVVAQNPEALEVHIFSKHLQFLDFSQLGLTAAELGFDGVDLTVRPGGHVEPEEASKQLPVAIEQVKQGGSACTLITTAVDDPGDPIDQSVLTVAADNGVRYYRCNWFHYADGRSMTMTLEDDAKRIMELGVINQSLDIVGCYQNHAGLAVGSSYWELEKILRQADPNYFGVQYDIRHAVVEGGLSWRNGLRLLHSRIKTIVLKDFKWEQVDGQWRTVNTPIGEGMVDFKTYFRLLKQYNIHVPASLHLEYPLGGAEHGSRDVTVSPKVIYSAMRKDLQTIRKLWKES